jgi:hypothetical protein
MQCGCKLGVAIGRVAQVQQIQNQVKIITNPLFSHTHNKE